MEKCRITFGSGSFVGQKGIRTGERNDNKLIIFEALVDTCLEINEHGDNFFMWLLAFCNVMYNHHILIH